MVRFSITKKAETYLRLLGKAVDNFNEIIEKSEFDYNRVSNILANAKSKFTPGHIPNWDMTMNEIIDKTEVWLITDEDAKITVRNRFTGEEKERLTIPKDFGNGPVNKKDQDRLIGEIKDLLRSRDSRKNDPRSEQNEVELWKIEEKLRKLYQGLWGNDDSTHTDWMGCYIPRTGTILIKIDCVDRAADLFRCPRGLLFEKVLLHEFIHAALDLWPRDAAGKISPPNRRKWQKDDFNEESIDNAIVLKLYERTSGYRDVKGFIETQPYYYRRAVELYELGDLLLDQLIEELIAYKISASVSTASVSSTTTPSTATSRKYTYYVNGHIVVIGKRAGIGAAAYEVFSRIIPTLSLTDVQVKYGHLKLVGRLPLVIAADSYKKSPNQKRYYKVPISTKDRQDIYLCSQWYDGPQWNDKHYDLLQDIVRASGIFPVPFPGGVYRKYWMTTV